MQLPSSIKCWSTTVLDVTSGVNGTRELVNISLPEMGLDQLDLRMQSFLNLTSCYMSLHPLIS